MSGGGAAAVHTPRRDLPRMRMPRARCPCPRLPCGPARGGPSVACATSNDKNAALACEALFGARGRRLTRRGRRVVPAAGPGAGARRSGPTWADGVRAVGPRPWSPRSRRVRADGIRAAAMADAAEVEPQPGSASGSVRRFPFPSAFFPISDGTAFPFSHFPFPTELGAGTVSRRLAPPLYTSRYGPRPELRRKREM